MDITNFAKKVAKQAGKLILEKAEKGIKISEKEKHDFVTNADKASQKLITNEIKKKFPEHAILAEESFNKNEAIKLFQNSQYIWIIDPLDGTTNFTHGVPLFSVSIALLQTSAARKSKNFDFLEGEIIAGVIYAPVLKELFHAEKGHGAYLNDKKIHVSNPKILDDSLTVTGFPPTHKEINLPYFKTMLNTCQAVRRLGSAALDLSYIAAGRFDGFWEFGLKPWDIAAGALIVKEAGGQVSDTNGNQLDLFGEDILATNGKIHKEMVEKFRKL